MQLNLLEKTELRIYGLDLHEVNLTAVAARAAKVLGLPAEQVLVVDVRDDHICLDILAKTVDMRQLIGKQGGLLDELRGIEGLKVREDAYVDSAGIMGLISCEPLQSERDRRPHRGHERRDRTHGLAPRKGLRHRF